MNIAFEDKHLSIQVGNNMKCNKLRSIVQSLIGNKYLNQYLLEKYQITKEKVYLKEISKAIMRTLVYIGKTANSINLHSNNEQNRGNENVVCPVCNQ